MATRVAVVGAGSWGTTVASLAARNVPAVLWARRAELAREITSTHENASYLKGFALHPGLAATSSLQEAVSGADVLVMGVPSHGFRSVLEELAPFVAAGVPVVSLAKGVEQGTNRRMTEVVADVLPGHPAGVLTGPNLAKEVLAGQPTASVIAMPDGGHAEELMGVFHSSTFRVYINPDVVGCEVAGALKNVVAIAVGMADGMGFGDNTKAALITRGLMELSRLGVALGGRPLTFAGLAGMGDLVATCSSPQSRNRTVGFRLGQGQTLEEIVADLKMVAEGVKSSQACVELGRLHGVEMPIVEQVAAVVHDGVTAAAALDNLLARATGFELAGIPH
jgi:glycerol-3-phosphate dehydrogenase (NAD(P)+)